MLDNDEEGNRTTNMILDLFPEKSIDKRKIYNNYKDFNDYLIGINKKYKG